jgi:uncharacterized protein YgbK (DUF1537 family)
MILAIADDLAGAAEVGGIAWRHGLSAEVQFTFDADTDADVVVIDTDTRSHTAEDASRQVAAVGAQVRASGVEEAFKKVDSVLRGRISAELIALLEAFGKRRCLLIPANPGLGRTISGGRYYVRGVPLDETDFSRDPEYPARTSDVVRIVRSAQDLRPGEALPARGIAVGDVTSVEDLDAWARALDADTLPAGASEFYAAYLRARGYPEVARSPRNAGSDQQGTELFVSGSTSVSSRSFCRRAEARGIPVLRMPCQLFANGPQPEQLVQMWASTVVCALRSGSRAVIAIDRPLCQDPRAPQLLSGHLSAAVEMVLRQHTVDRLYVEGGATAVALMRRLGWKRLRVCREWTTGVVSLTIDGWTGPTVTMKPGSYLWPDEISGAGTA